MKKILYILLLIPIFTFSNYDGWTKETAYKEDYLIKNGMTPYQANYSINQCKQNSKAPKWCVELITHLRIHEGARGNSYRCNTNNNCFGLYSGLKYYNNFEESFQDWLWRFNQYWYKNNCTSMIEKSYYSLTDKRPWISNCWYTYNNLNK